MSAVAHVSDRSSEVSMSAREVMLSARDITVRWGGALAVDRCSLQLLDGEAVCVLGRNGAGKTSFLSGIVGIANSTEGRVEYMGCPVPARSPHWLAQRGFVMVPEGRQLFGEMSVEDNLLLGAYSWSRVVREIRRSPDLAQVYDLFPRLEERKKQTVNTLSGGEQQMVTLARAMMGRPKVLVLDEPSLGLSASIIELTYQTLHSLRERGLTMLIVEESPLRALQLCDRGVVLSSGRIIAEAPTSSLLEPGELERLYLS